MSVSAARAIRLAAAVALALVSLSSCGEAESPPVRQLPDLDLGLFGCAPNRTHRFITSHDDLSKIVAELAPHCPPDVFEQRRQAFLRSLRRARVDLSKEVLVIAQDWYGTGMAKPGLAFTRAADGGLVATISWKVPPPPLTPDTASCTFAFAVKRSAVKRITVAGQHSGTETLAVSP
jgi:hypothetical protein